MKKLLFTLIGLFLLSLLGVAQTSQLKNEDIDHLLKTMKPVQQELAALSDSYEHIQDPTAIHAMTASEEAQEVLKKHGWDESYFTKISIIVSALAVVTLEKELEKMPADQRSMMEGVITQQRAAMTGSISEDDIDLVSSRFEELSKAFEDLD